MLQGRVHLPIREDRSALDARERNMKTKLGSLMVACVALFVSACNSSSPRDLIVGRWEAGEGPIKLTAEFTKGTTATLTMMGKTVQGTYKVNGDDELEWTVGGTTTRSKLKVTSTELELTTKEGKTIKYRKV